MKYLSLLVIAVTAVAVSAGKNPNLIGEFDSKDGANCKMLKLDMGAKTHAIVMECTCLDTAGHKQSYACSYYYKGDFEKCPDEQKVYTQTEIGLTEQSKSGACSAEEVMIPADVCPEGDVTLARHYTSKSISPCMPRDEL